MQYIAPIIIIDDDVDDLYFLINAFEALKVPNEIVSLTNEDEVFTYLRDTLNKPFLIFCDVNMPKKNGLELKRQLDSDPLVRQKCTPFIFYSTSSTPQVVQTAFMELNVQGYFEKGGDILETQRIVHCIIEYWTFCKRPPNRF